VTATQLAKWRAQFKLSQADAAKLIGCSRRSLQNWESGANTIPKNIAMAVSAATMGLPAYGDIVKGTKERLLVRPRINR